MNAPAPTIIILTADEIAGVRQALTATDMLCEHLRRRALTATGRELFDVNLRLEGLRREAAALRAGFV